jgi:methylamine dehydrogenase accessory protein MauD
MGMVTFAHLLSWAILLVLIALVFTLSRQLKVLFERVAPAGALMVNARLSVGERAPVVSVRTLTGELRQIGAVDSGRPGAKSRACLLVFVAPDCPVCRSILPAITDLTAAEQDVRVILASDGYTRQDHAALVEQFRLQALDYVCSEELGKLYGVSKLPYAVLIEATGLLVSFGIVNSREHLESLFAARELGVSSIQEYFGAQSQPEEGLFHDAGR